MSERTGTGTTEHEGDEKQGSEASTASEGEQSSTDNNTRRLSSPHLPPSMKQAPQIAEGLANLPGRRVERQLPPLAGGTRGAWSDSQEHPPELVEELSSSGKAVRIEDAKKLLRAATLQLSQMQKALNEAPPEGQSSSPPASPSRHRGATAATAAGGSGGTTAVTGLSPRDADQDNAIQELIKICNPLMETMKEDDKPALDHPTLADDWYKTRPLEGIDMASTTGNFQLSFPPRTGGISGHHHHGSGGGSGGGERASHRISAGSAIRNPIVNLSDVMAGGAAEGGRRRNSGGRATKGKDGPRPSFAPPSMGMGGRVSGLQQGGGSPVGGEKTTALVNKFTVTQEIMSMIKAKQTAAAQGTWSPTNWGSQSHHHIVNDIESNINAYVEYVCDDLRTAERKRTSDGLGKMVVDPSSGWKRRWDTIILALIIYSAYSVPYKVAFQGPGNSSHPSYGELVVDMLFLIDVALNFVTSYQELEGVQQTNLPKIARRYLRTWFLPDLLSSIPAEFFTNDGNHYVHYTFLALRLFKLLRLVRFARLLESKEAAIVFTPTVLRVVNSFMFLTWVWHVISCLYWYISITEGLTISEWTPDANAVANSDILNYCLSVVWTIQTTFSCSPMAPAETLTEALFTILCFMLGIFMNAYVIGSAGSALQNMDEERTAKRQLMDRIITYMKKRKLPPYFQRIILDFYTYSSDKHSEDDIFKDLPPAIQLRLSLLLNRELVKNIPLLKQLELNTIVALMQTLQSRMYLPGDFVFKIGQVGENLYFVKTGQLELMMDNENVVCNLQKGDMFGQVALQDENGIQEFNVRAGVYSEVLFLTKAAYLELVAESDKFGELVETEAIKQEQFIVRARKNLQRHHKLKNMGSSKLLRTSSGKLIGSLAEEVAASEQKRKVRLISDVAGALFSTTTITASKSGGGGASSSSGSKKKISADD